MKVWSSSASVRSEWGFFLCQVPSQVKLGHYHNAAAFDIKRGWIQRRGMCRFPALAAAAFLFLNFIARADTPLSSESRFASVDALVAAVQKFEPSKSDTFLGFVFSAPEPGQPEDPKTGTITRADKIASCETIWSDKNHALVFAMANPPIVATRSCVGVLFLLESTGSQWRIADQHAFHTSGKYAEIKCELSSGYGTGYKATPDTVIVTVDESDGGRGLFHSLSGSYRIVRNRIVPAELE
jgi:hypothetical protein